jgi:hypothetical protein
MHFTRTIASVVLPLWLINLHAAETDRVINASVRSAIIEGSVKMLNEHYMLPDQLPLIEKKLRERQAEGAYLKLTSANEFAAAVSRDMQEVSHDLHMKIRFRPDAPGTGKPMPREEADKRSNYGLKKVEILDGNIGYIRIDRFADAERGGPVISAAMKLVTHTDALILDFRNHGGGGIMASVLATYFFTGQPELLQTIRYPRKNEESQFWTLPYVPGERYVDKPVYVLTSGRTFSAAESFTYAMKSMQRATVVGEVTKGGGNPVMFFPVAPNFDISVPVGQSINAVTQASWEGVGVQPDVQVREEEALDAALKLARKQIEK